MSQWCRLFVSTRSACGNQKRSAEPQGIKFHCPRFSVQRSASIFGTKCLVFQYLKTAHSHYRICWWRAKGHDESTWRRLHTKDSENVVWIVAVMTVRSSKKKTHIIPLYGLIMMASLGISMAFKGHLTDVFQAKQGLSGRTSCLKASKFCNCSEHTYFRLIPKNFRSWYPKKGFRSWYPKRLHCPGALFKVTSGSLGSATGV